jgi:hypothetical protein
MKKPRKSRSCVTLTTRADNSPTGPRPRQPLRARLRLPLHGRRGKPPRPRQQQTATSPSKATRNSGDVAHRRGRPVSEEKR